jgi:hypothetical protein
MTNFFETPQPSYNAAGVLRLVEAVLAPASSLDSFISHNEDGNLMATWAFACRYRLEPVMEKLEVKITAQPLQMVTGLDRAISYAASLPSSSAALAISSLTRMLHNTSKSLVKLATGVQEDGDEILHQVKRYKPAQVAKRFALLIEEAKSVG